jgi:hypothetical protein
MSGEFMREDGVIIKYGPEMTWDELADDYPGRARIRPMEEIFRWAEDQPDKYYVHPEVGSLHRIIGRKG